MSAHACGNGIQLDIGILEGAGWKVRGSVTIYRKVQYYKIYHQNTLLIIATVC